MLPRREQRKRRVHSERRSSRHVKQEESTSVDQLSSDRFPLGIQYPAILAGIISLGLCLCGDLPAGVTPLLVDNVIGTGLSMKAALALVPSGVPCTIAVDTRRMSL